ITQLQLGQRLELECQTDKKDSGMFWVRQDKSGTLHFIVFISSLSRVTFERNQRTSTRFEASKNTTFYWLVVKSFTQQDEGNYFCLVNINQMLYFSHGLPAFFPGQQHLHHSTSLSSGKLPSTSSLAGPFFSIPAETPMQEELNLFCHTFIWVPLTGLCLLILQLLVTTIVLCR
ncbi:CD8A protein, partial [Pachyramphus minor]|nr:CD8A protein [Pachyramphus minor]